MSDEEYWSNYYTEEAKYHAWSRDYKQKYLIMNMQLIYEKLKSGDIDKHTILLFFENGYFPLSSFNHEAFGEEQLPEEQYPIL